MKKLLIPLFFVSIAISAIAQRDTVVTTLLREVAVVAEKQQAETELAPVSVISADEIQRQNIAAVKNISAMAPNIFFPDYGSRMTSSVYVRGLGARIDQPVVGLSIDNVPLMNKESYDFDLFDTERIEILRGAQSLLNGRNTMGGQINIFTLSPWRYSGWRILAEYARANSFKAGAGYYGRLSPDLATSITAYFTHTGGFFRNEYNNGHLDTEKQGSARWKLSWHPSTRLSVMNVASFSITRQGGYPYKSLESGRIAYNDTCFYRRSAFADGITIGWTGKRVIVNSVTSVQYLDDSMTLDQDFTPDPYFTLTQKRKEWNFTQDLYVHGRRGDYHWIGGVFAFLKNSDMQAPVTFKDTGITELIEKHANKYAGAYPIMWDERQFVLGSDFDIRARGFALYHQSRYKLGNWTFEAGLRWDFERPTLNYHSHCNTSFTVYHILNDGTHEPYLNSPVKLDENGHISRSYNELLPRISAGYSFGAGNKIYAAISKGYKSGGYNTQMFSDVLQQRLMEMLGLTKLYEIEDIVSYKPEKSWNFELGTNLSTQDGRLTLNADVFLIRCTDQQLTIFPTGTTTGRIMTNAGRTRSFGAEATLTYSPSETLTFQASYGYTNATFRIYNDGKADYRGKYVPYAPRNTLFLSADYQLPCSVFGATPSVNTALRGVGKIFWDEANTVDQPFYLLWSASAALDHTKWNFRIWAENITSTRYSTFYFVSMKHPFLQQGRPWNIGATLRLYI